MPRFIVSSGRAFTDSYVKLFSDSIVESSPKEQVKIKVEDDSIFLYTHLIDEPLKGDRYFNDEFWSVLFLGEVIDYKSVPFQKIIDIIKSRNFEEFKKFNGIFAIVVHNKKENKFFIIGDLRGQYPIYYHSVNHTLIISSELSSFCRLLDGTEFNENWLYDYMYFNFPLAGETFLKNINRLPYSAIIEYNSKTNEISLRKYADVFSKREPLLHGSDGLKFAKETFTRRAPAYFEGSDNIACALTGGWDGRTNLALAPNKNNITAYTYGGKNCLDLIYSKKVVKAEKIKHREIIFDEAFVAELPNLIFETIYLSSGLQGILRSTLLKVYSELSEFSTIISGIHYDGLFRGHIGGASIISSTIANAFRNGNLTLNDQSFKEIFKVDYQKISDHIRCKFNYLENELGDLQSAEAHSIFNNYIMYPNYFAGEYKIAERFSTLRAPAWDLDIINLSFSIEQSSLSFSEYTGYKRGSRNSVMLQSYLISQFAPELLKVPTVSMTNPKVVLNSQFAFKSYYFYRKVLHKLSNTFIYRDQKPLEDWNTWLNVNHRNLIDELIFSKDSLIQNYFTENYLNQIKTNRDHRVIGKLCTTEIILRLINNKWQRFW